MELIVICVVGWKSGSYLTLNPFRFSEEYVVARSYAQCEHEANSRSYGWTTQWFAGPPTDEDAAKMCGPDLQDCLDIRER